jgi:hypothetical protein
MSKSVMLIVPNQDEVPGLKEVLASWGEESVSRDPPRYVYGQLALTLVPIAAHVRRLLPRPFCNEQSGLELDEGVVFALGKGPKAAVLCQALQQLVDAISSRFEHWAVAFDPNIEGPLRLDEAAPEEVVERLLATVGTTGEQGGIAVTVVNASRTTG